MKLTFERILQHIEVHFSSMTSIKKINLKTSILVKAVCCQFWGLKAWGRYGCTACTFLSHTDLLIYGPMKQICF